MRALRHAAVAVLLVLLAGATQAASTCTGFSDVDSTNAFCPDVEWLKNRGITTGCAAGSYCPNEGVNRLAMAAFMQRLGSALSPQTLVKEQAPGALPVANEAFVCVTDPVTVLGFTRLGNVDAVFTAIGTVTTELAIEPVASLDGGATWAPLGSAAGATSVTPVAWSNVRIQGSIDLGPGTTVRFALRVVKIGPAVPTTLMDSSCTLRAVLAGRAETAPSFVHPVPTSGSVIVVPGRGSFEFRPGTFAASQSVDVQVTSDPEIDSEYAISGAIYLAGDRLPYEFRIVTGFVPPTQPVVATLPVPPDFLAQAGATHDLQVFGRMFQASRDGAYDHLEVLESAVDASGTLTVELPVDLFTDQRNTRGVYEAIVLVGTTTRITLPADASLGRRATASGAFPDTPRLAGYRETPATCLAGLLDSPLVGVLAPTDAFGGRHRGVDYDTQAGDSAHAAADGVVVAIGKDVRNVTNRLGLKVTGWGQFVAIRHAYGQTLYAHLEDDKVFVSVGQIVRAGDLIGTTDTSGGASGSHLHFEYARSGNVVRRTAEKIDPDPCIRPYFVKVDPAGTYLFVDADAFGAGFGDFANAPSALGLQAAGAQPGDFVEMDLVGAFRAGSSFGDDVVSMLGVFATAAGAKVTPGPQSTVPSPVPSLPTCPRQLVTDIAEDFSVTTPTATEARIPPLAVRLLFGPNDCFFSDNDDPNSDFGVAVRIWRPRPGP